MIPRRLVQALAVAILATPVLAASAAPGQALDGIRIGMTKAEAVAALKNFDPRLGVFEAVTVQATASGTALLLRSQFRPANPGYFSALVAARVTSEKDLVTLIGSPCAARPATQTIVTVQFDTDLRNPRVVLVDEYSAFCNGETTSEAAIAKLLERIRSTPDTSLGVRLVGQRWLVDSTTQTTDGYSVLQWQTNPRVGTSDYLSEARVESPMDRTYTRANGFGHPGGGIVMQSILKPKWPSATYAELMETLLWDDNALVDLQRKRVVLLETMARKGLSLATLSNPDVIDELMSAASPRALPGSPSHAANGALSREYKIRLMEGECTLPAGTPINVLGSLTPEEQKSYREPRVRVSLPPEAAAQCAGLDLGSRKLVFPSAVVNPN